MANDTIGVGVQEKPVSGGRVENSPLSLRNVKPPISATGASTHDQDEKDVQLEILQQALKHFMEAGGNVQIYSMKPQYESVAIVLNGVALVLNGVALENT